MHVYVSVCIASKSSDQRVVKSQEELCLSCAVVPLLLLFCQCGGADSVFPEHFSELPFDAKEHLISYHTEGRGEDKVCVCVCLLVV